jgi:serine/threonine-protein kinase
MNPYNYIAPVHDRQIFVGRANVISKIYSRIGAARPQSISIVGDPKIGKSSLVWYLSQSETKKKYLNNPEDYIYFYIPVVEKNLSFRNFAISLCKVILEKIQNYIELEDKNPSYDLFKKMVEKICDKQKKIILFFDDFHLTTQNESFPLEFFSFLRSLANNYDLAYVTTSHLDLQRLCVSKEIEESPFFNIFTNLSLKPFEASEASHLILEISEQHGVSLGDEKDRILLVAGHFPYTLHLACQLLFDIKKNQKDIPGDKYREFEETFEEKSKDYFETVWSTFDSEQRFVLEKVLRSQKVPNSHIFILNDLVRRQYLHVNGKEMQFNLPHLQKFASNKLGIKNGKYQKLYFLLERLNKWFNKT